jgi:FkbM family methyltransferase
MFDKVLRLLPNFPGKQRIAKVVVGSRIKKLRNITVDGKYNCSFFIPNIIENIGFELYINGVYEKELIDFLIKNIPRNKVLIDLGANIGAISLPVCQIRRDIKALCVEASPSIFDILVKNKENNSIKNAILINRAIFDENNKSLLFYAPQQEFGKGSFLPLFPKEKIMVNSITLAEIVKEYNNEDIGFIKVDIEGYEYLAFKGGSAFLSSPEAPDILFEFVDWAEGSIAEIKVGEAQKLLKAYGYNIFLFDNGKISKKLDTEILTGSCMLYATKKMRK